MKPMATKNPAKPFNPPTFWLDELLIAMGVGGCLGVLFMAILGGMIDAI